MVLGLLSLAFLCWDKLFVPWFDKKFEGQEERISSGIVPKILFWSSRIIGLGIVLGVFGWLIYDIFFKDVNVKDRGLMVFEIEVFLKALTC